MDENDWLAARFEEQRAHLRSVAYRMLGSLAEADDAVQNSWLRLSSADAADVENLGGWLTTVVSRECLRMLRSRRGRREQPLADVMVEPPAGEASDPEAQALLADSVGPALMVVLDTLAPAERLAFVLHDIFAVPFEEIAAILDRSPAAARQLASRAHRRVHGTAPPLQADLARQRQVVDAFLAAADRQVLANRASILSSSSLARRALASQRCRSRRSGACDGRAGDWRLGVPWPGESVAELTGLLGRWRRAPGLLGEVPTR